VGWHDGEQVEKLHDLETEMAKNTGKWRHSERSEEFRSFHRPAARFFAALRMTAAPKMIVAIEIAAWAIAISTVIFAFWPILAAAATPPSDDTLAEQGIRKLAGIHMTLYTDLPASEAVDSLPEIFEQAVPQWQEYFGILEAATADWRQTVCLMKDKEKFAAAGLLPPDLPRFPNGYTIGNRSWLFNQSEEYYRRELFLHESTHGFMHCLLHCNCPTWYMEGTAEYFGTHRWQDGRLTLAAMPPSLEESLGWGRVRLIQKAVAEHRVLRFQQVIDLPPTLHGDSESYAWYWAVTTLLDRHPRYQQRFRQLIADVRQPDFNERFYRLFKPDWQELCEEWQIMAANMDYGYDVARSAIDFTPGRKKPPSAAGIKTKDAETSGDVAVAADRGWQNTGLRLEAGVAYHCVASGRYQVAKTTKIWWCEPGGVSIRYYQGRPLGILLAAVRPDHPTAESASALAHPTAIGLEATLTPVQTGTLFLKINVSAGKLSDAAGELNVSVRRK
jgi:hypothetical protein